MTDIKLRAPEALVTCEWLAENLDDPNLRIFDCSTQLLFEQGGERPYRVVSCRDEHEAGHIPGAGCFDLQADFSRADSPFGMTLAAPEVVANAFAKHGLADGTKVILYSRRSMSWSTRFWWMLRWLGFDNAAVLDGGYEAWLAGGHPVSTKRSAYPKGGFSVNLRGDLFVGKEQVLSGITDPSVSIVNALGPDLHSGENPRYGRPGRIPGSVNVPKVDLIDPETGKFLPADAIAARFAAAGVRDAQKHITYCGGGIFATVDAFWLYQLGHSSVAVYDNSMSEWGPDPSLPIERG